MVDVRKCSLTSGMTALTYDSLDPGTWNFVNDMGHTHTYIAVHIFSRNLAATSKF